MDARNVGDERPRTTEGRPRAGTPSVIRAGTVLVVGAGVAGALNAAFSILLARVAGTSLFSAGGALLNVGTAAAAGSVGLEYAVTLAILQSGTFQSARQSLRRVALFSGLLLALAPLMSTFLRVPSVPALLAVVLADCALLAAIPTAMLVARGRVWALGAVAVGEGILRGILLLPLLPLGPLTAALTASIAVTVLGAAVAALCAQGREPGDAAVRESTATTQGHARAGVLALVLYLALGLPTWLARHLLPPSRAGVLALATLLGAGIAMFAGPVTSAVIPKLKSENHERDLKDGGLLCAGFAASAGGAVFVLAPLLLPRLVGSPLVGLRDDLGPLCLSGIGWAIANYFAWAKIALGANPLRFVAGALGGLIVEISAAFGLPTRLGISIGPLVALAVFLAAFGRVNRGAVEPAAPVQFPLGRRVPVSVGLMAHNEAELISRSMASILDQRGQLAEIRELVVVVSGATDGTDLLVEQLARTDSRIRPVIEAERRGKVYAVDRFLSMAREEVCVVASADVVLAPDCLDRLVSPLAIDGEVGMTGPRVIPQPKPGLVPRMHRVLWAIHNRLDAGVANAKLGEVVALRRSLARIEPVVGCDEVLLEASVVAQHHRLAYVPEAVVHNFSPQSLQDYIAHRRRVHAQHLSALRLVAYRPATLSLRHGVASLLREVVSAPNVIPAAAACCVAELVGRALGRMDVHWGRPTHTWLPTASARRGNDAPQEATPGESADGPQRTRRVRTRPLLPKSLRRAALVSALVQIALAPFTSLPGDVAVWLQTTQRAMAGIGLYTLPGFSYPPLYGYWCMLLGGAAHLLGVHAAALGSVDSHLQQANGFSGQTAVTSLAFTLCLKLPLIFADLLMAYYVWRIAILVEGRSRSAPRRARAAFLWCVFSPLVIVESAVHGQIDALAGCAIAGAVLCSLEGRWTAAGCAVALGIAAKLAPGIVIMPLLAFAMNDPAARWRNAFRFVGGVSVATAALLGPVFGPSFIADIFTRASVGGSVGGLGLTGLLSIPSLHTARSWVLGHPAVVSHLSLTGMVVLAFAIALSYGRREDGRSLIKACLAAVGCSLALSVVVNPQYLLWIAPMLSLGAAGVLGGRARLYQLGTLLLALGGVGYLLASFGWAELLAPASAALGWPSSATMQGLWSALGRRGAPTWLPATLGAKLILGCGVSVLIAAALVVIGLAGRQQRPSRAVTPPVDARGPRHGLRYSLGLVLFETAALCVPLFGAAPAMSAYLRASSSGRIRLSIHASGAAKTRFTVFALTGRPRVDRVTVYVSPTRFDSGATPATVVGTVQTLQSLLGSEIAQVSASQLPRFLAATGAASGNLLVVPGGTLPTTAWGPHRESLLRTWLHAGGLLAFVGNIPGFYAVAPGLGPTVRNGHLVRDGKFTALGATALLPGGVVTGATDWSAPPAVNVSRWGAALGLLYSSCMIPISASGVIAHGGTVLGLTNAAGDTSEAFLPRGRGGLLLFAGTDQPAPVAHDIARLVETDWFAHASPPFAGGSVRAGFHLLLPQSVRRVEVAAFLSNSQSVWIWSRALRWTSA